MGVELCSICSQIRKFPLAWHKLAPCNQHGFLRPEENIILNDFQHLRCNGVDVLGNILQTRVVVDGKPHMEWQMF